VGVSNAPAAEYLLSNVGVVIAPAGFKKQKMGWLRDDDPAIGKSQARRNVQLVRKKW